MPRSDNSSDPDDGSITSDDEYRQDDGRLGPTSPVQTSPRTPWQLNTNSLGGNNNNHGITQDLMSPSRRNDSLQLSRVLSKSQPPPPPTFTGPNARFRSVVAKVIRMNKMRLAGESEPGIDPRRESAAALYAHIKQKCSIQIVDYGPTKVEMQTHTNESLEELLLTEDDKRPLWSKVRWISVGGISWDVIRALALKYDIHPLSIEDILHGRQTSRSKADYYSKHLFIRVLCHTLEEDAKTDPKAPSSSSSSTTQVEAPVTNITNGRQTDSPVPGGKGYESDDDMPSGPRGLFRRKTTRPEDIGIRGLAGAGLSGAQPWLGGGDVESQWAKKVYPELVGASKNRRGSRFSSKFMTSPEGQKAIANQATVNALKQEERVTVKLSNLYLFLFRDGTFISVHQDPEAGFFAPIVNRLRQRDTLLRSTADASLLLQGTLDLVVDSAVRVVDRYHAQLLKFERDILIKPKMKTVRYLHIASGDLTMHKRTLSPLKSLIYGLRRYDLDRALAQANPTAPGYDEKQVVGFMSHKAKVYLADVMDHTEYILASLEMFESISENLIAYTFNIVAYETNTTMRGLTIATVIFFPLTFMTGYFGMNFEVMPSVKTHSEAFFWEICVPVMTFIIVAFTWPDIMRFVHYIQKKMLQKRVTAAAPQWLN